MREQREEKREYDLELHALYFCRALQPEHRDEKDGRSE